MGRPREFEMDAALKGAMDVFWRQGYAATNLPDLLSATGLTRGSFYKAFRDKESLYLATLDHYDRDVVSAAVAVLENCEADTASGCLALLFAGASEPGRGCFICNAMVELGPVRPEVAKRTNRMAARLQQAIEEVLVRFGQAAGRGDAREKANLILHLYFGHQALGKTITVRHDWMHRLADILYRPAQ